MDGAIVGVVTNSCDEHGDVEIVVDGLSYRAAPGDVRGDRRFGSVVTVGQLSDTREAHSVKVVGHISDLAKPVIEVWTAIIGRCCARLAGHEWTTEDGSVGSAVAELIATAKEHGLSDLADDYRAVVILPTAHGDPARLDRTS